jgi:hypothetical protein
MAMDDVTALNSLSATSENEEWKPVVGLEDCYEVSSLGRIRSLPRRLATWYGTRASHARILKTKVGKNGYLNIALQRNRELTHTTVHAVVLKTFVGQPWPGQEVMHINGDRLDCRLSNLSWGTRKQNMFDQYRHGTRISGERHPRAKLTNEVVAYIKGSSLKGNELAKQLNLGTSTISRVRNGLTFVTLLGEKPSA